MHTRRRVEYVEVDPKTKKTEDGADFHGVHPLGLVPTLLMDHGEILTENAAILQHIADRYPEASLAPRDAFGRSRLHEWLGFVGTELHKGLYVPLLDKNPPAEMKQYALTKAAVKNMRNVLPSSLKLAARSGSDEHAENALLQEFYTLDGGRGGQ